MEVIVTTESQLAAIVQKAIRDEYSDVIQKVIRDELSSVIKGTKDAVKQTFDMDEAAQYLKLSKSHLWKLTAVGKIPCSKIFGRLKFDKRELDAWMEGQGSRRGDSSSVVLSLAKSANRKLRGSTKIVKNCSIMSCKS